MDAIINHVQAISPAKWCQIFFAISAGIVLLVQVLPQDVSSALMNYGARRPQESIDQSKKQDDQPRKEEQQTIAALKQLAEVVTSYGQVPHQWFLHFYILSTSLSAFWAWQYITKGSVMRELALRQDRDGGPSMSLGDVYVAWLLMALQGGRRLYESLFVTKSGSSPMWVVHWALGLVYYASMSVSVWIQGSSAILASWEEPDLSQLMTPSTPVGLALFVFACAKQNECHRHLASLKKYTLPSQGWFRYIICPHYTFECLIYLAIAWVAALPGQIFNHSVLLGLLFVAVNLGATAHGTKKWYAEKFGADKVAKRWKMIPFVL